MKAIAADNRDVSNSERQSRWLGCYCATKYTPWYASLHIEGSQALPKEMFEWGFKEASFLMGSDAAIMVDMV